MPKQKISFNEIQKEHFHFVKKSQKGDIFVFRSLCRSDLKIGSKGKCAIKKHASTDKHKLNMRSAKSSLILLHFAPKNSIDKSTAAELCKVYHAVQHHQSYHSLDCGIKLDQVLYADSTVAKGITCRRTKEPLCTNFPAPYSLKCHVDYILQHGLVFSLSTDTSNKGSLKCFLIACSIFILKEFSLCYLTFMKIVMNLQMQ